MLANFAMKRVLSLIIILVFVLGTASCARKPKPKSAESKIKSFFIKYGKEYPSTEYGQFPVKEADVGDMEEIHKHLISVPAFITLGNGDMQKILVTFERRAYWKIVSWERVM